MIRSSDRFENGCIPMHCGVLMHVPGVLDFYSLGVINLSVINFVECFSFCQCLCVFCVLGMQQLLIVAGTIPEHKTIAVSQNSRMHVSLCLSKIYEDLISDQERDLFLQAVNSYFEYVQFLSLTGLSV